MPKVEFYLNRYLFQEVYKLASEKGKPLNDFLRELIEAYVKGELVPANECRRCNGSQELAKTVEDLQRRIELLEEMVKLLLRSSRG